jgi:hypothetical protein
MAKRVRVFLINCPTLDEANAWYLDLYDLAPLGYFTLRLLFTTERKEAA